MIERGPGKIRDVSVEMAYSGCHPDPSWRVLADCCQGRHGRDLLPDLSLALEESRDDSGRNRR